MKNRTNRLLERMVCCAALGLASLAVAQPGNLPADPLKKGTDAIKKLEPKSLPATPTAPAVTPPAGTPTAAEMEKAWMEASAPGDMQKLIAKFAGTWNCTVKTFMPGMESQSTGVMTTVMVLGDRFAHSTFKGDFGGQTFEGAATMGFNNLTSKFESTWIDSMSTNTQFSTGSYDAATKTFTMTGKFIDPMTHAEMTQREVTVMTSDTAHHQDFFQTGPDGKETKAMSIDYVRADAPAKPATDMNQLKDQGQKKVQDGVDKLKDKIPGTK